MNFSELTAGNITGNLYVIEGDDSFLKAQALAVFRSIVPSDISDINVAEFSDSVPPSTLVSAIDSLPFMADRRLVIVRDWELKSGEGDAKDVVSAIKRSPQTVCVFIADSRAVPAPVKKAAITVSCKRPSDFELAKQITAIFSAAGVLITERVALMLATYVGLDTGRATIECKKLISSGLKEIREEDVKNNVHRETDYAIFALTNALAAGNKPLALAILTDLTVENPPASILANLYKNYRRVLSVSLSKESDAELASTLDVQPYAVKKLREQAKRFTQVEIKRLVDKLNMLETDFKLGRFSDENAMWLAIFNIFET